MGVAMKKMPQKMNQGLTKREFEQEWLKLYKQVDELAKQVTRKADDVVLTMALSHREEMDVLQDKLLTLEKEIKHIKEGNKEEIRQVTKKHQNKNFFRKLFFSMKSTS